MKNQNFVLFCDFHKNYNKLHKTTELSIFILKKELLFFLNWDISMFQDVDFELLGISRGIFCKSIRLIDRNYSS